MTLKSRSLSFKLILFLALLQGILGALRAYNWFDVGVDLLREGLLLLPFVGTLAVMHGLLIAAIAFLYLLSVIGALLEKDWARPVCLTAAVLNLVIVVGGVIHGGRILEGIAWSVVPMILLWYLFSAPKTAVVTST